MNRTMLLLLLPLAAVACRDQSPTAPADAPEFAMVAGRPAYLVTGGGSVVREDIAGSPREIYGFTAQVDAQGNVRGSAEVHFPSDAVKMHIAVQCLVLERNIAWMSGPVTRSDDPATPVGRVFLWQVQDNGAGQGAPPDRISNFIHGAQGEYATDVCRWKPALVTFPWDNGNVSILTPGMPGLADLVGTWDATVLYFVNPANPADTADLFESGGRMRWTVAPNGRWTQIWWTPEAIFENTSGVVDLINGQMVMWADGQPTPTPIACEDVRVTGQSIGVRCDVGVGYDWDGDGTDDPSRVVGEWRRKRTGVLINDLAGTWDATLFRYTSTTDPSVTVEGVADLGYAITMTVRLDSRFFIHVEPLGWTSTTDHLLVEGDRMLTRNGDASAFVFSLVRDTWSFTGLDEYDFEGDGTPDPAMLEVVLVRR